MKDEDVLQSDEEVVKVELLQGETGTQEVGEDHGQQIFVGKDLAGVLVLEKTFDARVFCQNTNKQEHVTACITNESSTKMKCLPSRQQNSFMWDESTKMDRGFLLRSSFVFREPKKLPNLPSQLPNEPFPSGVDDFLVSRCCLEEPTVVGFSKRGRTTARACWYLTSDDSSVSFSDDGPGCRCWM